MQLVIALNIKHAFGCSQNSAISFVIALPGNNACAIMKLISGRQIGQKWSYNDNCNDNYNDNYNDNNNDN